MNWLHDLLLPGFYLAPNGEGGGGAADDGSAGAGTSTEGTAATAGLSSADVERMVREGVERELAKTNNQATSHAASAAAAAGTAQVKDPYDQATEEAKQFGVEYDKDWINRRALKIQADRFEETRERDRREFGSEVGKLKAKDTVAALVGDNPHAQEYARKFIERAGGSVTDPELIDLLKRGARDYAAEKTPSRTDVHVEAAPGGGGPIVLTPQAREDMSEINSILSRVNPKAALTEADLK